MRCPCVTKESEVQERGHSNSHADNKMTYDYEGLKETKFILFFL